MPTLRHVSLLYNTYACAYHSYSVHVWENLLYELLYGKNNETIYVPRDCNKQRPSLIILTPLHLMGSINQSFLHDSSQTRLI